MNAVIRVLIVDDSAYVRKVVRQMLERSPFIEVVGAAHDGLEALELVDQLKPDIVTLDLHMPVCDGLTFLKAQMARRRLPVLILSSASESGELVLQALDEGAVDVIQKPTALASEKVLEISAELIEKIKAIAAGRVPTPICQAPATPILSPLPRGKAKADILVIGVSTGGPQALKRIIPQLPADFPIPVAIVLHMPVGYTELFASSLNEISALKVTEAQEGAPLQRGQALIAPAGFHLTLRQGTDGVVVSKLGLRPLDLPHRPSVDVLFRSAAECFGEQTLGVILTGMGSDGKEGCGWIKARGGRVFTEAESTCVVYGMPRSVAEAGLSDRIVPLDRMTEAIVGAL